MKNVCRLKENGGLGVKDLKLFNMDLLAKWKERIVPELPSFFLLELPV